MPDAVDCLVELSLSELDFLASAFGVEQPIAHGDGDLIHVSDLGQDLLGHASQTEKRPLFSEGALVTKSELVGGQASRELEYFLASAPRDGGTIGESRLIPVLFREPEPTDVLDAIEGDAARDGVPSTEMLDRGEKSRNGGIGIGHTRS
jgi:hypothetical protein